MVTKIRAGSKPHLYIVEHVEDAGLTWDALGGRLGVARSTAWRWANHPNLKFSRAEQIAHALGKQLEDLTRPPHRPSIDAMLREADDDTLATAKEMVEALLRRRRA